MAPPAEWGPVPYAVKPAPPAFAPEFVLAGFALSAAVVRFPPVGLSKTVLLLPRSQPVPPRVAAQASRKTAIARMAPFGQMQFAGPLPGRPRLGRYYQSSSSVPIHRLRQCPLVPPVRWSPGNLRAAPEAGLAASFPARDEVLLPGFPEALSIQLPILHRIVPLGTGLLGRDGEARSQNLELPVQGTPWDITWPQSAIWRMATTGFEFAPAEQAIASRLHGPVPPGAPRACRLDSRVQAACEPELQPPVLATPRQPGCVLMALLRGASAVSVAWAPGPVECVMAVGQPGPAMGFPVGAPSGLDWTGRLGRSALSSATFLASGLPSVSRAALASLPSRHTAPAAAFPGHESALPGLPFAPGVQLPSGELTALDSQALRRHRAAFPQRLVLEITGAGWDITCKQSPLWQLHTVGFAAGPVEEEVPLPGLGDYFAVAVPPARTAQHRARGASAAELLPRAPVYPRAPGYARPAWQPSVPFLHPGGPSARLSAAVRVPHCEPAAGFPAAGISRPGWPGPLAEGALAPAAHLPLESAAETRAAQPVAVTEVGVPASAPLLPDLRLARFTRLATAACAPYAPESSLPCNPAVMPQSLGGPRGISFSLSRAVVENGPDNLKLIPQGRQHPPETEALHRAAVPRWTEVRIAAAGWDTAWAQSPVWQLQPVGFKFAAVGAPAPAGPCEHLVLPSPLPRAPDAALRFRSEPEVRPLAALCPQAPAHQVPCVLSTAASLPAAWPSGKAPRTAPRPAPEPLVEFPMATAALPAWIGVPARGSLAHSAPAFPGAPAEPVALTRQFRMASAPAFKMASWSLPRWSVSSRGLGLQPAQEPALVPPRQADCAGRACWLGVGIPEPEVRLCGLGVQTPSRGVPIQALLALDLAAARIPAASPESTPDLAFRFSAPFPPGSSALDAGRLRGTSPPVSLPLAESVRSAVQDSRPASAAGPVALPVRTAILELTARASETVSRGDLGLGQPAGIGIPALQSGMTPLRLLRSEISARLPALPLRTVHALPLPGVQTPGSHAALAFPKSRAVRLAVRLAPGAGFRYWACAAPRIAAGIGPCVLVGAPSVSLDLPVRGSPQQAARISLQALTLVTTAEPGRLPASGKPTAGLLSQAGLLLLSGTVRESRSGPRSCVWDLLVKPSAQPGWLQSSWAGQPALASTADFLLLSSPQVRSAGLGRSVECRAGFEPRDTAWPQPAGILGPGPFRAAQPAPLSLPGLVGRVFPLAARKGLAEVTGIPVPPPSGPCLPALPAGRRQAKLLPASVSSLEARWVEAPMTMRLAPGHPVWTSPLAVPSVALRMECADDLAWPLPVPIEPPTKPLVGAAHDRPAEVPLLRQPLLPEPALLPVRHRFYLTLPPPKSPWKTVARRWKAAAGSGRFLILGLVLLAVPGFLAWKSGAGDSLRLSLQNRAAIELEESFSSGLSQWMGLPGDWSRDPAGFMRVGSLALLRPSVGLADYRLEFLAQVGRRSFGWVFRASDLDNYYATKMAVTKAGPLPSVALERYQVIDGKEGPHVRTPLRLRGHDSLVYKVVLDVKGNDFTTLIDGQVVDFWSDDRLKAGGVGFFGHSEDRGSLYWVRVSHQDDLLGKLCAYLAPKHLKNRNGSWK